MQKAFLAAHWSRALRFVGLLFLLSISGPAFADDSASPNDPRASGVGAHRGRALLPYVRTDLHGVLTWEAEFGAGLRADILLFGETRLYSGRDEIALSVGCDLSFVTFGGQDRVTVWPTVALQWSLSVSERFVFYPELGIVAQVQPGNFKGLFPNVGFGGRINVYETLDVVIRLGWPMAVTAGITF